MDSGTVEAFQKMGAAYTFIQDLSAPNSDQEALYINNDNSILAIGDLNGLVRVFDIISGTFTLKKNFTVPHVVRTLKIENNNLLVGGTQYMRFYKWNGIDYLLDSMLSDGNSGVGKIGISDDFQKIAYGESSLSNVVRER